MANDVLLSSGNVEWETPADIYGFLQGWFLPAGESFDLDAAATKENAKCKRYYDREQNGLLHPWNGNVFVNPPYGRGKLTEKWVRKAMKEMDAGNPEVIVALLPSRTDTVWFHELTRVCAAVNVMKRAKGGWDVLGVLDDEGLDGPRGAMRNWIVELTFVQGRIQFEAPGKPKNSATFPSLVAVFEPGV